MIILALELLTDDLDFFKQTILEIQFETGPHLFLQNISRHSDLEYECVARNKIEPDPSRHFKINVNCKISLTLIFYLLIF